MSYARLARLDAEYRDRGYDGRMVAEARRLAADLGEAPPAWARPANPAPAPPEDGESWHRRRRDEQLRREWERWRYQRSKLPPGRRGRMMEPGQRQCRWCETFFEPTTLRQRYCTPTCRKLAHKAKVRAR
jgi:hypothetical protein